jgi:hypothetical protein
MLRVVDIAEPAVETVTVGEYVPLTVEWKDLTPPTPAYWRPSADDRSLVEVGVHPETGRVCSITVVLPGAGVRLIDGVVPRLERPREHGHPVCDLAPWGTQWLLDEVVPFTITVDAHSVAVWFTPEEEAAFDLVSGTIVFHLSAERIILGVTVLEVPQAEMSRLRETLIWIQETAGRRSP